MRRKITFLFCMLISWAAASFAQTDIPVKFSSDDGIETYWYYVNFDRRTAENLVWAVDIDQSGEVQQKLRVDGDHRQQWKFVGNKDNFYVVNRETGHRMAYTGVPITDSNGKPVPLITSDNSVYYVDKTITLDDAAKLKFYWVASGAGKPGWAIINPALGGGTPYLNDRATRNVCNYGATDSGCLINFIDASTVMIIPNTTSLIRDGLVNTTSTMSLSISSLNISGTITCAISGTDANVFSFEKGVNTLSNGTGVINIDFTPTESRGYTATLTLSSTGAPDVTVALSGVGFDESEMPFTASSADEEDEHWYYIQFKQKAADHLVWSLSDTTKMIVQDTLRGGVVKDKQQWKIADWDDGYYISNRHNKMEIAYNTKDVVLPGENSNIEEGIPADRYIAVEMYNGNYFEFSRRNYDVNGEWVMGNITVSYLNAPARIFVNDFEGKFIRNYPINYAGNELVFIPVEKVTILAPTTPVKVNAPAGEAGTVTYKVGGVLSSTDNITVSINGEGTFAVEPAILPATGGNVTITFTCPADDSKQYMTKMTLKCPGAEDVVVDVTGVPAITKPQISTAENEYWYYLQFTRQPSKVWQGDGADKYISQAALVDGQKNQQWKFVSANDGGYLVENREGGQMFFEKDIEDEDDSSILAANGTPVEFIESDNDMMLQIYKYFKDEDEWGAINDFGGSTIGLYYTEDVNGNSLKFIPAGVVTYTGINKPDVTVDSNDQLIDTKYYTLQGVQVKQPNATGIYIVRKIYASGKTQSSKVLVRVR